MPVSETGEPYSMSQKPADFLSSPLPTLPITFGPEQAVAHRIWTNALASVLAEVLAGPCVVNIVGAAGTGKTLLLEMLTRLLDRSGMNAQLRSRGDGALLNHDSIVEAARAHQVVMIDEADRVNPDTLAMIRKEAIAACAWVLASKSELVVHEFPLGDEQEPGPKTTTVRLGRLPAAEVRSFVSARLVRSGLSPDLLTDAAVAELGRRSGGIPRVINMLLGAALFLAHHDRAPLVGSEHIEGAAALRNLDAVVEGGDVIPVEQEIALAPDAFTVDQTVLLRNLIDTLSGEGTADGEHRRIVAAAPELLEEAQASLPDHSGVETQEAKHPSASLETNNGAELQNQIPTETLRATESPVNLIAMELNRRAQRLGEKNAQDQPAVALNTEMDTRSWLCDLPIARDGTAEDGNAMLGDGGTPRHPDMATLTPIADETNEIQWTPIRDRTAAIATEVRPLPIRVGASAVVAAKAAEIALAPNDRVSEAPPAYVLAARPRRMGKGARLAVLLAATALIAGGGGYLAVATGTVDIAWSKPALSSAIQTVRDLIKEQLGPRDGVRGAVPRGGVSLSLAAPLVQPHWEADAATAPNLSSSIALSASASTASPTDPTGALSTVAALTDSERDASSQILPINEPAAEPVVAEAPAVMPAPATQPATTARVAIAEPIANGRFTDVPPLPPVVLMAATATPAQTPASPLQPPTQTQDARKDQALIASTNKSSAVQSPAELANSRSAIPAHDAIRDADANLSAVKAILPVAPPLQIAAVPIPSEATAPPVVATAIAPPKLAQPSTPAPASIAGTTNAHSEAPIAIASVSALAEPPAQEIRQVAAPRLIQPAIASVMVPPANQAATALRGQTGSSAVSINPAPPDRIVQASRQAAPPPISDSTIPPTKSARQSSPFPTEVATARASNPSDAAHNPTPPIRPAAPAVIARIAPEPVPPSAPVRPSTVSKSTNLPSLAAFEAPVSTRGWTMLGAASEISPAAAAGATSAPLVAPQRAAARQVRQLSDSIHAAQTRQSAVGTMTTTAEGSRVFVPNTPPP